MGESGSRRTVTMQFTKVEQPHHAEVVYQSHIQSPFHPSPHRLPALSFSCKWARCHRYSRRRLVVLCYTLEHSETSSTRHTRTHTSTTKHYKPDYDFPIDVLPTTALELQPSPPAPSPLSPCLPPSPFPRPPSFPPLPSLHLLHLLPDCPTYSFARATRLHPTPRHTAAALPSLFPYFPCSPYSFPTSTTSPSWNSTTVSGL